MRKVFFILIITASISQLFGQVYTNKEVGKKNVEKIDSIKAEPYPYQLPIWGSKAAALGYTLPLSAGFSVNYFNIISNDLFYI